MASDQGARHAASFARTEAKGVLPERGRGDMLFSILFSQMYSRCAYVVVDSLGLLYTANLGLSLLVIAGSLRVILVGDVCLA